MTLPFLSSVLFLGMFDDELHVKVELLVPIFPIYA